MNTPKGGYAFPHPMGNGHREGMTLRDWIAGKVLQAHLSIELTHTRLAEKDITPMETVNACYQWADLMLIARGKEGA